MYTILTHAENLSTQLLENRPPIKVLIISNFDHAISLTFVDMLSYYCNNRFTSILGMNYKQVLRF